jgi:4-diphosphocytidyl-2-C-methyl-D-erythritol kinase
VPRRVRVEARAKLNLGLAIGPKRADGFHELATVFQSIDLADTLIATRRRAGFSLSVRFEDAALPDEPHARSGTVTRAARTRTRGRATARRREPVPAGARNLVLKAARLLASRLDRIGGAHFDLIKRIPAQSGLGGGSADAAAALVALAALYGVRLTLADRLAVAAELGSDVPFAMLGGTALGLGRGERLTPLELDRMVRAVVAVPAWRVSTADAFSQIERNKYGLTAWMTKLGYAKNLVGRRLKPEQALALGNTMEAALGSRRSDFLSLCSRMNAAGVSNARMTGSGSAVFGILGPGLSAKTVAHRLAGNERIYSVCSTRAGLRLTTLP